MSTNQNRILPHAARARAARDLENWQDPMQPTQAEGRETAARFNSAD